MCCIHYFIYTSSPSTPLRSEILLQTSFFRSGYGDTERLNTSLKVMYLVIDRSGLSFQLRFSGSPLCLSAPSFVIYRDSSELTFHEQRGKFTFKKAWECCASSVSPRCPSWRQNGLTTTDGGKHQFLAASSNRTTRSCQDSLSMCCWLHAHCVVCSASETKIPILSCLWRVLKYMEEQSPYF